MGPKCTRVISAAAVLTTTMLTACGGTSSDAPQPTGATSVDGRELLEMAGDLSTRGDIPLAYLGDEPITFSMLEKYQALTLGQGKAQRMNMSPDMIQPALASLLDIFLFEHLAREMGLKPDPDLLFPAQLEVAKIYGRAYSAAVLDSLSMPSDEEIQAWFDRNPNKFGGDARVSTRHILVPSEAEANALKTELENGADFGDLALAHSQDAFTKDIGGNQGWLKKDTEIIGVGVDPGFYKSAMAMAGGEVSVLKSSRGWHVVQVTGQEGAGVRPLEDVYDQIKDAMIREKWADCYNDAIFEGRIRNKMHFISEGIDAVCGVENHVSKYLQLAKDTEHPQQRTELFRRVAFDFWQTEYAPEAMFYIVYENVVNLHDHWEARHQLDRLLATWPNTKWAKAARELEPHIDPDAPQKYNRTSYMDAMDEVIPLEGVESAEAILARVGG